MTSDLQPGPNRALHSNQRTLHPVWDRTTRWFHWINFLCVLVLSAFGTAILYKDALGIGPEGVILLKTLHVYTGYVFVLNLLWRLVWTFVGNPYARWKAILPFRRGYMAELGAYVRGFFSANAPNYLGHDPLARLMVTLLLALLIVQGSTGLILAGTDLYKPPFGGIFADWVTAGDAEKLANLKPGSKEFVDVASYDEMRAFRSPIVSTHEITFYILMVAVLFHIGGSIVTEIRHRQGVVSAMFTGEKSLPEKPMDVQ